MRLVLASGSRRRQEILRNAGYEFEVCASGVREDRDEQETAEALVRRLALEKARQVAREVDAGCLVLGADTVVLVDEDVLGKPADAKDAARMLRRLSGRSHRVLTGVCLMRAPGQLHALEVASTAVVFRTLDEAEIRDYAASAEPLDKAGAYAIQGRASRFVTRVEGCYFNVVGLPISLVDQMLKSASDIE